MLLLCLNALSDQRWIDWLASAPDHPATVATFEKRIADMESAIDFIVYQRAREILGLKKRHWRRPDPAPLRRRKSRSYAELWERLERCVLRFADIDRLAQRRAEKLQRLLSENPLGAFPHRLAAKTRPSTSPAFQAREEIRATNADLFLPQSRSGWGRWIDASSRRDGGGSRRALEGLRVRAPPWPEPSFETNPTRLNAPASEVAPVCAGACLRSPKRTAIHRARRPCPLP